MTDKKLISSLQGLRAVAFLCIVLSHCGVPWLSPWAITVFVALSGFLMTCNYYDRPRTAPGVRSAIAFSLQKIRKLYPLHLIMMAAALLFVLKGLLAQLSVRGALSCAAQLVVNILLLQTWIPSSRFWFCLNGVAWYLSVQAFLYAIFPPLLAVLKKADARRLRCIAAAIFCVQCLFSLAIWKAGLSGKAAFYLTYLCPLFRAGDFTISCCMGCLYHSRRQESTLPRSAFSLLELATVLLAGGSHHNKVQRIQPAYFFKGESYGGPQPRCCAGSVVIVADHQKTGQCHEYRDRPWPQPRCPAMGEDYAQKCDCPQSL